MALINMASTFGATYLGSKVGATDHGAGLGAMDLGAKLYTVKFYSPRLLSFVPPPSRVLTLHRNNYVERWGAALKAGCAEDDDGVTRVA